MGLAVGLRVSSKIVVEAPDTEMIDSQSITRCSVVSYEHSNVFRVPAVGT